MIDGTPVCLDCATPIARPSRGRPAKRCPECRIERRRESDRRRYLNPDRRAYDLAKAAQRYDTKRVNHANPAPGRQCSTCQRGIDHLRVDAAYCSDSCRDWWRDRRIIPKACDTCGASPIAANASYCAPCRKARDRSRTPSRRRPRTCQWCGESFTPSTSRAKFCSRSCAGRRESAQSPPIRPVWIPCKQCRRLIAKRGNVAYCSDKCRRAQTSDRLMGLYREALKVIDVKRAMVWQRQLCHYLADRDGQNCGICGSPVDLTISSGARGNDAGPSIDHIVPRSRGGSDDLTNLRLTHWSCNRGRGNRATPEEMAHESARSSAVRGSTPIA